MRNFVITLDLKSKKVQLLVLTEENGEYKSLLKLLSSTTLDNNISLTCTEELEVPYLVTSGNCEDVTAFFELYLKVGGKIEDNLLNALSSNNPSVFSKELLIELFKSFQEWIDYRNKNGSLVKIKVPVFQYTGNFSTLQSMVNKINNSATTKELFVEGENKTLFRPNEDSELFLEVPDYDALLLDKSHYIPSASKIETPYGQFSSRQISVLKTIDYGKMAKELDFPIEYVEGNPMNNDLPIQESEKRWKTAMMSLMDIGIIRENPDKTLEECINNGIASKVVLDYLTDLGILAYRIGWMHTELMPRSIDEDIEEDEDNDDDSENKSSGNADVDRGALSNESFSSAAQDRFAKIGFRPADTTIKSILGIVARKGKIYETIDIVIKLFRFGKYKPTRIPAGGKYFDVFNGVLVDNSGDFSSLEEIKDEEGNNLFPVWLISLNNTFSSPSYLKELGLDNNSLFYDIPIGITFRKTFKNTDGQELNTLVSMSMFDLVNGLKGESNWKIKGISYKDGSIKVDPEIDEQFEDSDYQEDLDSVLNLYNDEVKSKLLSFWNYSGFVKTFFDKDCYTPNRSILRIVSDAFHNNLRNCSALSYSSIEELDSLIITNGMPPVTIIESNILNKVFPIITNINNALQSQDNEALYKFSNVLKLYEAAINNSKFNWSFNEQNIRKEPKKEEKPVPTISQSTSFAQPNTGGNLNDAFIKQPTPSMQIIPITVTSSSMEALKTAMPEIKMIGTTSDGRNIVGLIGMDNSTKEKVLLDVTNLRDYDNIDIRIEVIIAFLLRGYKRITAGKPAVTSYENIAAVAYYSKLFEKAIVNAFKD